MKQRRFLLLFLAALFLCSLLFVNAAEAGAELPFSDVTPQSWSYPYIKWGYENQYFYGKPGGVFAPHDNMTRGEMITILGRFSEKLGPEYSTDGYAQSVFSDVPSTAFYAPFVGWAQTYGIVSGTSATTYAPDMRVSREQFVTIAYRFLVKYIGVNADLAAQELPFPDRGDVASYAEQAVKAAYGNQLIAGRGNGTFDPKGNVTREEACTILSSLSACITRYFSDENLVIASQQGFFPNETGDCSEAFETMTKTLQPGQTLVIPRGNYRVADCIMIENLSDVTIDGNGATMIQAKDGTGAADFDKEAEHKIFCVSHTDHMTVCNFNLGTERNAFIGGVITDYEAVPYTDGEGVNRYHFYLYYTIDDGYVCTGEEVMSEILTLNSDYQKDGALERGNALLENRAYEEGHETYLGQNRWRLELDASDVASVNEFSKSTSANMQRIIQYRAGQRVVVTVLDYSQEEGAYVKREGTGIRVDFADTLTLDGIHIYTGCFSLTGLNRDLTFRNCFIKPKDTRTAYSCAETGIWGVPPKGELVIENMEFFGFGDDQINLFPRLASAYDIDTTNNYLFTYNSYDQFEDSVEPGDVLFAYDPITLEYHGSLTVERTYYTEGTKRIDYTPNDDFAVEHRDLLDNTAVHPDTTIRNCTFRNGEVRGILYQTGNLTVDSCTFRGVSCGISLMCDFDRWSEGGPVDHVTVRNCTFENSGTQYYSGLLDKMGGSGIVVYAAAAEENQGVIRHDIHTDITIENNTFRHIKRTAIEIAYADGVTVDNNRFEDCCWGTTSGSYRFRGTIENGEIKLFPNGLPVGHYQNCFAILPQEHCQVYIENSSNVSVTDNRYDNLVSGTQSDDDGNNNDVHFLTVCEGCPGCTDEGNTYTGS